MLHGKQIRITEKGGKQVTFTKQCSDNIEINIGNCTVNISEKLLGQIYLLMANEEVKK